MQTFLGGMKSAAKVRKAFGITESCFLWFFSLNNSIARRSIREAKSKHMLQQCDTIKTNRNSVILFSRRLRFFEVPHQTKKQPNHEC